MAKTKRTTTREFREMDLAKRFSGHKEKRMVDGRDYVTAWNMSHFEAIVHLAAMLNLQQLVIYLAPKPKEFGTYADRTLVITRKAA